MSNDPLSTDGNRRRPMVISPLWLQGTILTFVVGFTVLGYLAFRVYQDHAPMPERIASEKGETILTRDDILKGQQEFLTYGLMEYGSIYGHGAYLGPDFTADYLHGQAVEMAQAYGGGTESQERVRRELQANRYDSRTDVLTWTDGQVRAFEAIARRYESEILNRRQSGAGMGPGAIPDPGEIRQITAFIAWTAWTASARRPDRPYSYTNNWPPEPLVGNDLTRQAVVWSTLSITTLLGGIGLVLALFGRYSTLLGWHGEEQRRLRFLPPALVPLTPAQRATAWYFLVVSVLFLIQTLLGGATAHYHAETGGFFGLDLARLLPYNLSRTWHLQLAIFFVATAYLAAGIFLAPLVSGREPRGQQVLAFVLLGALAVVVFGSMAGEAASYKGWLGHAAKPTFGAQG